MRRTWAFFCLVALAASSCKSELAEDDDGAGSTLHRVDDEGRVVLTQIERTALDLQTVAARRDKLATRAVRFGKVSARAEEQTLVVAPVTARLVAPPKVTLGSEVAEGTVLAAIEPLPDSASRAGLAAQRRELQGQVEGARARVHALQTEVDRISTLLGSGLATEADKSRAQADLQEEQARLESLRRAGGEIATMTTGSLPVRAPAAGVLAALASDVGTLIQQGDVIARILRAGPRWVDVAAAPADEVGSAYRVRAGSGWLSARLLSQGAVVQSDGTRLDRVEIAPPEAARVLPGATVAVEVVHESEGVIVPESAVVLRGTQPVVFVQAAADRFAARDVTLGGRSEGQVMVRGVQPNERVVARGAPALLAELGYGAASPRRVGPP